MNKFMEETMEETMGGKAMEKTMEETMGVTMEEIMEDTKGLQGMTCGGRGRGKPRAEPWCRQRHSRRVEDDYMIILEAMLRSETIIEAMRRRTLKVSRPQL